MYSKYRFALFTHISEWLANFVFIKRVEIRIRMLSMYCIVNVCYLPLLCIVYISSEIKHLLQFVLLLSTTPISLWYRAAMWLQMTQCWLVFSWTLKDKLKWNSNRNLNIVIKKNVIEIVVCKMATFWRQYINETQNEYKGSSYEAS